jgi:alpha-D-xyloside xylohydrolase
MEDENWALLPTEKCIVDICINENEASIKNGKIRADIAANGNIRFYNQKGNLLLEEYNRNRMDISKFASPLNIKAREFKANLKSDDYKLTVRFESDPEEKIFGMGQYQQPYLNIKNCVLELAHRNSQASVPFAVSSIGYGFLWNNPAIGKVSFGKNLTEWVAESTKQMDYWITAGDTPAEIEEAYAKVTGTVPMMPDYGMGFWQCKLRYQTQDELLNIAREYKRRGLPIDVIVIDFFHWPLQGDWKFDPEYWPDPDAMVKELKDMGIELMVSIWPTVDKRSENYEEMLNKGYLVRTDRGIRTTMEFMFNTVFFDPTNPGARNFVWNVAKRNYYDKGIKIFWLDEAEPEYSVYDYDNYRYYLGPVMQVGNIYPVMYAKTFFDGMTAAGQQNVVNLLRCAWAGSQRYGALVWSGDIHSSFRALRDQLRAGLNMGLAGIPWWTTDIGGFHGGNPDDPAFRECLVRWFQFGAFCPVFRLHGDREPHGQPIGPAGGGALPSGAANEVWSYGQEAYEILKKYMFMRERLRPYIKEQMKAAHEKGTPVIRPIFYDFPDDSACWDVDDQYMFGPDILVAPILYEGQRTRKVYLPEGIEWRDAATGTVYEGGQCIKCDAPLDVIPLFLRGDVELPIYE